MWPWCSLHITRSRWCSHAIMLSVYLSRCTTSVFVRVVFQVHMENFWTGFLLTYAVWGNVILPVDVDLSRPVLMCFVPPGFLTVVLPGCFLSCIACFVPLICLHIIVVRVSTVPLPQFPNPLQIKHCTSTTDWSLQSTEEQTHVA